MISLPKEVIGNGMEQRVAMQIVYIIGISNFQVFHNIKEHYKVFYNIEINILSKTLVKVVLLPFTMHYIELLWFTEQISGI